MKKAYDMITKLKENDEKKQREIDLRYSQAKEKIETLRLAVAERDQTIAELQNKQVCLLLTLSSFILWKISWMQLDKE